MNESKHTANYDILTQQIFEVVIVPLYKQINQLEKSHSVLLEALKELIGIVDGMANGNGEVPSSFTTQPAKTAVAKAR